MSAEQRIGSRHGTFTVVSVVEESTARRMVVASCICGATRELRLDHFIDTSRPLACVECGGGHVVGRSKYDTVTPTKKHPATRRLWYRMHDRCRDPNHDAFKYYGGRGIKVCERWGSFDHFLEDMGPVPSPLHSIDRKDGNGNYDPGNCRWATKHVQMRNFSRNHWIVFNGERLCLYDWAAKAGLNPSCLLRRLQAGWSVKRSLTEPSRHAARSRQPNH